MTIRYKTKAGKINETADLSEKDAKAYGKMLEAQGYEIISVK